MPLCPENSYGMDVGRELGEVTADCYLAARLGLIDDATMDRIHAEGYRSEGTPFDQMIHGLQGVNQYLVDKIDGLGASERFALSFLGAMDSDYELEIMAQRAASVLIQGRIMTMVQQGHLSIEDLEAAQDRHFCSDTQRVLTDIGAGMGARLQLEDDRTNATMPAQRESYPEVFQDKDLYHPAMFNQVLLNPKVNASMAGLQRMDDTLQAHASTVDLRTVRDTLEKMRSEGCPQRNPNGLHRADALLKKNRTSIGRKILRRSMTAFKQLIGANELKAFLGEDGLTVQGHYFDYKLKRNEKVDLVNNAYAPGNYHIPYQLTLIDKSSGLEMADVCVYFRDTPALDQVAAMLMHLQTGEEKAILSKANIFNVRPDFYRVMENIVTEIPAFDRQVGSYVKGRQSRLSESRVDADLDSPNGLFARLEANRMSHPGHRLVNEHKQELITLIKDHYRNRLTLSPMFKGLMELGKSADREALFGAIQSRKSTVNLADFCRDQLRLDWQPPELNVIGEGFDLSR